MPLAKMLPANSMSFGLLLILLFPVEIISSVLSHKDQQKEEIIWVGQSSGFTIRWTPSDIKIVRSGDATKVIFSAKEKAQRDYEAFRRENIDDESNSLCSYEESFRLLCVIGTVVSYEEKKYFYCRAAKGEWAWPHPSSEINYWTVDLESPGKHIALTNFFSESEILKVLLADPLVGKAFENHQIFDSPKTVVELVELFQNQNLTLQPSIATTEIHKICAFTFSEDILKQFAFHHVEGNKVAVRISLIPSSGACRTAHAQLGILLPIPDSLREPLVLAQSGNEGFLMKDVHRITNSRVTRFIFGGARGKNRK